MGFLTLCLKNEVYPRIYRRKKVKFLECIRDKGLDEFHRMARCQSGYSYLRVDYEGLMIP